MKNKRRIKTGIIFLAAAFFTLPTFPTKAAAADMEDVHSVFEPGLLEKVTQRGAQARQSQDDFNPDPGNLMRTKQGSRAGAMSTERSTAASGWPSRYRTGYGGYYY